MLTDRFTARVLGGVVLVMMFLIDVGSFLFTRPEISHRPSFPLVVLGMSLPLVLLAVWLFRRAAELKDD